MQSYVLIGSSPKGGYVVVGTTVVMGAGWMGECKSRLVSGELLEGKASLLLFPDRLHPFIEEGTFSGDQSLEPDFIISQALTSSEKQASIDLLRRRYSWRKYETGDLFRKGSSGATFNVYHAGRIVATLTVVPDGAGGFSAEETYPDEVTQLRLSGRRLCEFTGLALAPGLKSKKVLRVLFQVARFYASRILGCQWLICEVSPRHAVFYEKVLGMQKIASDRICVRVNTPSILFCLDFLSESNEMKPQSSGCPPVGKMENTQQSFFKEDVLTPTIEEKMIRSFREDREDRKRLNASPLTAGKARLLEDPDSPPSTIPVFA